MNEKIGGSSKRPIRFLDYLPQIFRASSLTIQSESNGSNFLGKFLKSFEKLFEDLQENIEGVPDDPIQLAVHSIPTDTKISVESFNTGPVDLPKGTSITVRGRSNLFTILSKPIPSNGEGLVEIEVQDLSFATALQANDVLIINGGGVPDLFDPITTPPPQFEHLPQSDLDYLNYLASWIALSLRNELVRHETITGTEGDSEYETRIVKWNREFFKTAISLYQQRGTMPGLDALLRAWLKGELSESSMTNLPLLILTDLTRVYNDVDAVFQLTPEKNTDRIEGEIYSQLGINTVLGEGPPFFFIVDLIADPNRRELRMPIGLDVFWRSAQLLIDAEKPAYTYYQLRMRANTMQLAPTTISEDYPYAQIGVTTLLFDEPWVFNSDC